MYCTFLISDVRIYANKNSGLSLFRTALFQTINEPTEEVPVCTTSSFRPCGIIQSKLNAKSER